MASPPEIVPGLSVQDFVNCLQAPDSGFDRDVSPEAWTAPPEVKVLSEGKGYCSVVYSVTLHTPEGSTAVAIKIPTAKKFENGTVSREEAEASFRFIADYHRNEVRFYKFLRSVTPCGLRVLRSFGGRKMTQKQAGFLLLEDASDRVSQEKFTGIKTLCSWQIEEIIDEIAKRQAAGFKITPEENFGLGKTPENIQWLGNLLDSFLTKLSEMGYDFVTPERRKEMLWVCSVQGYNAISSANEKENFAPALIQGDFWVGNILFSPSDSVVAFIDWQAARFANFAIDLALLLTSTLSGTDRRRSQDCYLQFYMHRMKHHLNAFGVENCGGFDALTLDAAKRVYSSALQWATVSLTLTCVKYDSECPAQDGREGPLANRLRCCLEDLWP